VPVTVVILIAVFAIQRYGTHRVGRLFGPIMVVWFVVIAVLGVRSLARQPVVLTAVDPRHAVSFFMDPTLLLEIVAVSSALAWSGEQQVPAWYSWLHGPWPSTLSSARFPGLD
jgi:KUP system potassium uptake protein